ncbi:TetR/AcrR family transcriptional regulator [Sandaracinobacter sp.]|uniref:TetR/AcrR family transcriptional regulator n=1 Tax=Sandaracinobacter sp. TaxID=2487581 RepID=UPI0035AFC37A
MSRKTPTQARALATRRAILNAAHALLETHEPEDIGTVQIAERAGVPVGSIYRYYANRSDIFRALAQEAMELVDAPLESMLLAGLSIEVLVRQAVGLLLAANTVADRRLQRYTRLSPDLNDVWVTSNLRVEMAVAGSILARNPALDDQTRTAAARVLIQAVLAGIDAIIKCDDADARGRLQGELVTMAVAYVKELLARTDP